MVNLRHFLLTCEFKIDLFSLSASSEESVMACLVPQSFGVIKGLTMDYNKYSASDDGVDIWRGLSGLCWPELIILGLLATSSWSSSGCEWKDGFLAFILIAWVGCYSRGPSISFSTLVNRRGLRSNRPLLSVSTRGYNNFKLLCSDCQLLSKHCAFFQHINY